MSDRKEKNWRDLLEEHENIKAEGYVLYLRRSRKQKRHKYGDDEEEREKREKVDRISIEQQREACQYIAKSRNLKIVATFEEEVSARKPGKRNEYKRMMAYLAANQQKFGVLAWAPDRLTRNALEAGELIQAYLAQEIIDFQFVTYHFHQDSSGLEHLLIEFARAMGYTLQHRKNVLRGMRPRYEEDREWLWPEKFGYRYLLRELPNGRMANTKFLVPHNGKDGHAGEFQVMELAFDLRMKGWPIRKIVQEINKREPHFVTKKGKRVKLHRSKLAEYLKEKFYYGVMEVEGWPDIDIRDRYEINDEGEKMPFVPVILEAEYLMCQQVNAHEKRGDKTQKHSYLPMREMVKCAHCKRTIQPQGTGEDKPVYFYCYNMQCPGKKKHSQSKQKQSKNGIKGMDLFDAIEDLLKKGMKLTQEDLTVYLVYIEQQNQLKQHIQASDLKSTSGKKGYITSEMDKLSNNFMTTLPTLKDPAIKKRMTEQFESEMREWDERLKHQLAQEHKIRTANHAWTQKLSEWLELAEKSHLYWKKATLAEKKEIAELIFLELTIENGKLASWSCTEEFAALEVLNLSIVGGAEGI